MSGHVLPQPEVGEQGNSTFLNDPALYGRELLPWLWRFFTPSWRDDLALNPFLPYLLRVAVIRGQTPIRFITRCRWFRQGGTFEQLLREAFETPVHPRALIHATYHLAGISGRRLRRFDPSISRLGGQLTETIEFVTIFLCIFLFFVTVPLHSISDYAITFLPPDSKESFDGLLGISAILLVFATCCVTWMVVLVIRSHRIIKRLMSLMPGLNRGCSYWMAQMGGYAFAGILISFAAAAIMGSLAPLGIASALLFVVIVVFFVPMMWGLLFTFIAYVASVVMLSLMAAIVSELADTNIALLGTLLTGPWSNLGFIAGFTYGLKRRDDHQIARLISHLGKPLDDDRSIVGE